MDVHTLHSERVGHHASVLPTGATEAGQRVFRHVIAALHTDVLDRIGHVFNGDAKEACGNFLC